MAHSRLLARRLVDVETASRFEPLTIGVDQRHQRHRCAAQRGRQQRDVIESTLGRGIEQTVTLQCGQAGFFVRRKRGFHR
jgi:hypothetical protein